MVDSLGHGLLLPCRPEFGGLLSDELDLLLAVSLLVVLSPFVDVLLTILQHSIDESGKPMSHGCDGFGAPSSLRKRRYCAPRYVWLRSKVEAPSRNAVTARLTTWRVPRASTLFLLRPAVRHSFSSVLIPVLLRGNEDPVRPVDERLKKLSNGVKGPLHPGPCHQTSYRPYRSHAYRQARSAISHIGLSLPNRILDPNYKGGELSTSLWNTSPNLRRAWPNSTLRRRLGTTLHDTYSPNWNALTFDTFPT